MRRGPRAALAVSWLVFALAAARAGWLALSNDVRRFPLTGDQANFVMQAISLGRGFDLTVDAGDYARWHAFGWAPEPTGTFVQHFGGGWAYAKPYGYSLWLAPFVRALGPAHGIAVANTLLLAAVAVLAVALVRRVASGPAVPLLAAAFLWFSNLFLYAYPVAVELFLATLVALSAWLALRAVDTGRLGWLVGAAAVAGFVLSEKPTLLLALGPLLVVAAWRQRRWGHRLVPVAVAAAVLAISVVPYLHYSGGRSATPYGGDRWYLANGLVPGESGSTAVRAGTEQTMSARYVRENVGRDLPGKGKALGWYFVGRYTGLVVFMPVAVALLALGVAALRRTDAVGRAALVGLGLYIGLYVVLFWKNYYGGGQTVGNRYFVQVSPLVLVVLAGARVKPRRLSGAAVASMVVAVVLMGPQLWRPQGSLYHMDRTSPVQRLLPGEVSTTTYPYFLVDTDG